MKIFEPAGQLAQMSAAEGFALQVLPHGELKAGDLCPQCASAPLDYNGLLQLTCPECGYSLAGCFT